MNIIRTGKIMINTIVRVIPIGLYLATLLSSMLLENNKGLILFMGQAINDLIGLSYRFLLKPRGKVQCAIVRVGDVYYTMPAPYVQVVAYYCSFFVADMYLNSNYNAVKFVGLVVLLLLTVWSRIDVECKDMLDVVLAFAIGTAVGFVYYYLVRDYYNYMGTDTIEDKTYERDDQLVNDVFRYFN